MRKPLVSPEPVAPDDPWPPGVRAGDWLYLAAARRSRPTCSRGCWSRSPSSPTWASRAREGAPLGAARPRAVPPTRDVARVAVARVDPDPVVVGHVLPPPPLEPSVVARDVAVDRRPRPRAGVRRGAVEVERVVEPDVAA